MAVTSNAPTAGDHSDLSQARVADLISASGLPWRPVSVVGSTGSTNSDLMAAVAAGTVAEGAVIAAGEQVSGRGRLGRSWASPPGTTLSFSVLLAPPLERAGFVPALTALAVSRAIAEVAGLAVSLKWPNDVMLAGGKVAGILAEGSRGYVVVGCGVNVRVPQADLPVDTATSLSLHGGDVDRSELLVMALRHLHAANDLWREAGYSAAGSGLLDAYRAACATIGSPVRVSLPDGTVIEGLAESIDDAGRLVLAGPDGSRTLTAGDVVHLRSA